MTRPPTRRPRAPPPLDLALFALAADPPRPSTAPSPSRSAHLLCAQPKTLPRSRPTSLAQARPSLASTRPACTRPAPRVRLGSRPVLASYQYVLRSFSHPAFALLQHRQHRAGRSAPTRADGYAPHSNRLQLAPALGTPLVRLTFRSLGVCSGPVRERDAAAPFYRVELTSPTPSCSSRSALACTSPLGPTAAHLRSTSSYIYSRQLNPGLSSCTFLIGTPTQPVRFQTCWITLLQQCCCAQWIEHVLKRQ